VPVAFAIVALLVVGAFVGSALNFGGLILGVPLVFLFIGAILGKETLERQQRISRMKRFRRDSHTRKVEFDQQDRRTLSHSDLRVM
jgi:Sec-independent protein secretion pathway component TatC